MALEIYYNFVLTLALILIAARLGGEIMERYFGQPPVLGELVAGMIVSPFALGGLLFPGDPILLHFGEFELIGRASFRETCAYPMTKGQKSKF